MAARHAFTAIGSRPCSTRPARLRSTTGTEASVDARPTSSSTRHAGAARRRHRVRVASRGVLREGGARAFPAVLLAAFGDLTVPPPLPHAARVHSLPALGRRNATTPDDVHAGAASSSRPPPTPPELADFFLGQRASTECNAIPASGRRRRVSFTSPVRGRELAVVAGRRM